MTSPRPLDYQSPPTRGTIWKRRLLGTLRIVPAHLAAILIMVIVSITLPLIGSVALYIAIAASEASAGKTVPSPRGIGLIFTVLQVASGIVGLVVILVCIILDLIRRLLRQGWWRTLATVTALIAIGVTIWMMQLAIPTPQKLRTGAVIGLILEGLFCAYWVPLGCAEAILKSLTRRLSIR